MKRTRLCSIEGKQPSPKLGKIKRPQGGCFRRTASCGPLSWSALVHTGPSRPAKRISLAAAEPADAGTAAGESGATNWQRSGIVPQHIHLMASVENQEWADKCLVVAWQITTEDEIERSHI